LLSSPPSPCTHPTGVQFAQTYSQVAEAYLLTDREPENSIIFFGVQIFTVPSVSAYLVSQHHFLSHLIAILFAFFTEQLDSSHPSGKKHLVLPPNPTIRRIDPESPAFKQKRYFQVFSDLNHLISSPAVQALICDSSTLMEDFSSFLALFTSMNPNTRAVNTHVEYESDLWVIAFNVTIQLGKICRSFGEAYRRATPLQLARGLSALLARMSGGSKAAFHAVAFGGATYQLADFDVASKPVSFHHPLAWLFAEMVKNVDALDQSALEPIGVNSLSQIALGRQGQLVFLASMDHPLRGELPFVA
jgi:E3 ubiquitin-protein ligase UBR1